MADSLTDITVAPDRQDTSVLVITLDRPDRRNAMSVAMVQALLDLLQSPEGRGAGALVLTGSGSGYCAGSDLVGLSVMTADERTAFEDDCGLLSRLMVAHPRPILSAVHGYAIGGGLTLAAASDFIITTADAKWSLPEVPIGLFPAWGLEPVATRLGVTRARQLSFGLDTLSGDSATAQGLADAVAADPLAAALERARALAALPAAQVASVKDYFAVPRQGEAADRHALGLFAQGCESPEGAATFARFAAKSGR